MAAQAGSAILTSFFLGFGERPSGVEAAEAAARISYTNAKCSKKLPATFCRPRQIFGVAGGPLAVIASPWYTYSATLTPTAAHGIKTVRFTVKCRPLVPWLFVVGKRAPLDRMQQID